MHVEAMGQVVTGDHLGQFGRSFKRRTGYVQKVYPGLFQFLGCLGGFL